MDLQGATGGRPDAECDIEKGDRRSPLQKTRGACHRIGPCYRPNSWSFTSPLPISRGPRILPHPAPVELTIDLQAIADNYRLLAAKV